MPLSATDRWLAPAAIPTATAKITNAVSTVSRTTVLNRTIDSAPTRLNALATLSPMTCVTIAIKGVNGAEKFWEPDWGDFTVTDKRVQPSTQWSYDPQAGQEIRSVEVRRFLLKPRRAGKLRIGEAKLRVDGKEYKITLPSEIFRQGSGDLAAC